jgi:hypothetical protein
MQANLKKGFLALLIFFVLMFVVSWESNSTTQVCSVNEKTNHEYCATHYIATALFFHLGAFFKENGEALIAAFTVVLAISTIGLWYSTRDAARGAERAATIAERTLTDLERPWVFVRLHPFLKENSNDAPATPFLIAADDGLGYPGAASDPPDRIPLAVFDISNHGRMPGIITDCHILLEPVDVTAHGAKINFGFIHDDFHGPIGPGETRDALIVDCPAGMEYGIIVDVVSGNSRPVPTRQNLKIFVFRIVIAYRDIAGDQHVSSFCWRMDEGMGYWVQHGGAEYNFQT